MRRGAGSFGATLSTTSRTPELIAMSARACVDHGSQLEHEAVHGETRGVAPPCGAREVVGGEERVGNALHERKVEAFGEVCLAQVEWGAIGHNGHANALEVRVDAVAAVHIGGAVEPQELLVVRACVQLVSEASVA